jgi:AbiTii
VANNAQEPSLVEQLQAESLNRSVAIEDLLRKAKVVAAKLDLMEFQAWVECELSGYTEKDKVPRYRIVQGQLHGLNPMRGWIPLTPSSGTDGITRTQPVHQAISELSDLLHRGNSDAEGILAVPLGSMMVSYGGFMNERTLVQLHIDRAAFAQILDAVRNTILDWSLKLEKAGITGVGLSFSREEKHIAHSPKILVNVNTIEHFAGVMGENSGRATIHEGNRNLKSQIDPDDSRDILSQILKHIDELVLTGEQREALDVAINELQVAVEAPTEQPSRLRAMFESVKRILESAGSGAATDIVKVGIIAAIKVLLGTP